MKYVGLVVPVALLAGVVSCGGGGEGDSDGSGGGADRGSTGGQQPVGTFAATWTFPALNTTTAGGSTFPTYLAHLLGKTIQHPYPTDIACATVVNGRASTATARLSVALAGYSTPGTVDVSVPAGASKKACVEPALDKNALYRLTAPDTTTLRATATDLASNDVGSAQVSVTVPPVDDIAWSATGIALQPLRELSAVFVEPNAPTIDNLQRSALGFSRFGTLGDGGDPYQRSPYARDVTIDPGMVWPESFYLESAESIFHWQIGTVSCTGCVTNSVDVAVFTRDQYNAYMSGTSTVATGFWPAQTTGGDEVVVLGPGSYVIAFMNSNDHFTTRRVTWARTVTREDVAKDVLTSLFSALRAAQVSYSDVSSTFFSDWQHVRRVTQSLSAMSANCIDGAFVFASAAELLGLEPVLIFKTGHAYVGIRSAPGSSTIWPIETTLLGSLSTTPTDAYIYALISRASDVSDPGYQEVDIKSLRARGVTPLVQQ